MNVEKREKGEKRGIKVSSRGQKRKKERRRGRRKKKRRNVSRGCGRCRGRWWLAMVMVVVAVRENRVRPLAEEEFVSEERSVGKEEGRRWCTVEEEERDFRVAAEVIEGSHYRYTVASLLSFALLMIYRKQINDLYSTKQIATKDIHVPEPGDPRILTGS